jgi:hypothetical protein
MCTLTVSLPNGSERLCCITLTQRCTLSLPPSPLAALQRPCRPLLSLARARRKLNGASHRSGLLHYQQISTHYLQCIGEHWQYSANGQRQVIYFRRKFSVQMTWRPLGTGELFHQHSTRTLISPRATCASASDSAPDSRASGHGSFAGPIFCQWQAGSPTSWQWPIQGKLQARASDE